MATTNGSNGTAAKQPPEASRPDLGAQVRSQVHRADLGDELAADARDDGAPHCPGSNAAGDDVGGEADH